MDGPAIRSRRIGWLQPLSGRVRQLRAALADGHFVRVARPVDDNLETKARASRASRAGAPSPVSLHEGGQAAAPAPSSLSASRRTSGPAAPAPPPAVPDVVGSNAAPPPLQQDALDAAAALLSDLSGKNEAIAALQQAQLGLHDALTQAHEERDALKLERAHLRLALLQMRQAYAALRAAHDPLGAELQQRGVELERALGAQEAAEARGARLLAQLQRFERAELCHEALQRIEPFITADGQRFHIRRALLAEGDHALGAMFDGTFAEPDRVDGALYLNCTAAVLRAVLDHLTCNAVPYGPQPALLAYASYWAIESLRLPLQIQAGGIHVQPEDEGFSATIDLPDASSWLLGQGAPRSLEVTALGVAFCLLLSVQGMSLCRIAGLDGRDVSGTVRFALGLQLSGRGRVLGPAHEVRFSAGSVQGDEAIQSVTGAQEGAADEGDILELATQDYSTRTGSSLFDVPQVPYRALGLSLDEAVRPPHAISSGALRVLLEVEDLQLLRPPVAP